MKPAWQLLAESAELEKRLRDQGLSEDWLTPVEQHDVATPQEPATEAVDNVLAELDDPDWEVTEAETMDEVPVVGENQAQLESLTIPDTDAAEQIREIEYEQYSITDSGVSDLAAFDLSSNEEDLAEADDPPVPDVGESVEPELSDESIGDYEDPSVSADFSDDRVDPEVGQYDASEADDVPDLLAAVDDEPADLDIDESPQDDPIDTPDMAIDDGEDNELQTPRPPDMRSARVPVVAAVDTTVSDYVDDDDAELESYSEPDIGQSDAGPQSSPDDRQATDFGDIQAITIQSADLEADEPSDQAGDQFDRQFELQLKSNDDLAERLAHQFQPMFAQMEEHQTQVVSQYFDSKMLEQQFLQDRG